MSRTLRWSFVAMLICFAAPLRAQALSAAPADTAASGLSAAPDTTAQPAAAQPAPSASVAPVGFHYATPARTHSEMAAARSNMGLGQSRALMIVGAAGILVGAIVGGQAGTVIMVSGAVVGLVGLYEYMQ